MNTNSEPIEKEMITVELVKELVDTQFPQWKDLSVAKVLPGGWDNVTFRLGDELLVRLPSASRYATQVSKEQKWLPRLSETISFEIPCPVEMGVPSCRFPWNWSVYKWIPGDVASTVAEVDNVALAKDLAQFLIELHDSSPLDGPKPGDHNFHRGGSLRNYKDETYSLLQKLKGIIDTKTAEDLFQRTLATEWKKAPVWVHGDLAATNLLVSSGRLKAVIDFGSSAVGDPACDLAIAWTFLGKEGRRHFKAALKIDEATWTRGRGWVLWKSMHVLWSNLGVEQHLVETAKHIIEEVVT